MRLLPLLLLTTLPFAAFAAGSDDSAPPTATQTTTECKDGQVWDDTAKKCVAPQDSRLDDDARFGAVRELAWAGRYDEAMTVLAAMTEGETDRVMTYKGFILRKSGQIEAGIAAYEAALRINPGNILTHSYYGQLLVEMNEPDAARVHLAAIRANGGSGTWAEIALASAIETGLTYTF
ncbi:tetratricopeptide repeat protein [Rhodobacter sp. Har01]|uniref:tetratricopeptide repeat protein n=1 Tax=Rhodobacter sp. Har01 TaxID=2883999 RepID=UPI001D093E87|nr:tetratricopeptide repeat protein [Rhodobacter sp. Har01]MCB6177436.1 tetratricopeptide repeat protein [Rhodobacter sp. Har01]